MKETAPCILSRGTRRIIVAIASAAALAAWSASVHAATVNVQATSSIWLATQPAGSGVTGYFGTDYAPANSPVELALTGGALTFSASGSTSVDGNCFAGPDGGSCYPNESGFSPSPASAAYNGPATALIGIFENGTVNNVASSSPFLDYTVSGNFSKTSYSPGLNQIFFIGDGLTGTGSGSTQLFNAPAGATLLFLAVADSIGARTGNVGFLTVEVNGATPVPLPAAAWLMMFGLGGLGLLARRRKA